jgi:hypothetical protein
MEKVYITKYALSSGILEKKADIADFMTGHKRAFVEGDFLSYGIGSEAFLKKEDAIENAEKRRRKKIESLKKKINKLENLKFE